MLPTMGVVRSELIGVLLENTDGRLGEPEPCPQVDEEGRLHLVQRPDAAAGHVDARRGRARGDRPLLPWARAVGNNVDLALGTTVIVAGGFDPSGCSPTSRSAA